MKVGQLKSGQKGIVSKVLTSEFSTRLLGLGIMPGRNISVKRVGPFGSPFHIQIGNQSIVLDKLTANTVLVTQK